MSGPKKQIATDQRELQLCWDAHLVQAWHREWSLSVTCMKFMTENGCDIDVFKTLRRAPPHLGRYPVRAFVSSMLPKLSSVLWGGKYTPQEVWRWLSSSGMRTNYKKNEANAAHARRRRALKQADTHNKRLFRSRGIRDQHDWKTVS